MTQHLLTRRNALAAAGAALATGMTGLLVPARAAGLAPTKSMKGGANNYIPGIPVVDQLGEGGFLMTGTVRSAADGAPLAGLVIQIWAHTVEGREPNPKSHGATLTRADGSFELDMPQIVPVFGQPHGHLAYDDGAFRTVFLRPIMRDVKATTLNADFVLEPV